MSGSVWYSYLHVSQCVVQLPVCQSVCGIVTCMSASVWYSYLYVSQCVV